MPNAPETPPHARVTCGARTRSGGTCGQCAMAGQRRCRYHGGASPQALRAAKYRIERARVSAALGRLGVAVEGTADPLEVLAHALSVASGDLHTMQGIVAKVEPTNASDQTVRLYAETLDRASRLAKIAADTNLAERQATVADADALAMRAALERAMALVGLALDDREPLMQALAVELKRPVVLQLPAGAAS